MVRKSLGHYGHASSILAPGTKIFNKKLKVFIMIIKISELKNLLYDWTDEINYFKNEAKNKKLSEDEVDAIIVSLETCIKNLKCVLVENKQLK